MEPDFWHQRWQRGETGWHQSEPNFHLREHWPRLEVRPGERVFVPLCGKTLDMLWLAGEGYRVVGVEVSPVAVVSFFRENGLKPKVTERSSFQRFRVDELEILCGDFFDLVSKDLEGVTATFDRASLIALPPGMRPVYARHLQKILPAPGRILLITLDYDQTEMEGPPFSVTELEVRRLLGEGFDVRPLADLDIWSENPGFQERGLSRLRERVYALDARPRQGHPEETESAF
jgi:thiopurine S-methyltransferase